jgi:two-component system chemotaxis sensor kinase CheA
LSNTSIRDIFFQECEDLSDALTDGLNDMAEGTSDEETVNAVFRAVHSIKGSGGAFGLEDLVNFAHKFETVLDSVRSHSLAADDNLMPILLRSGDVLIYLIEAARTESAINQDAVDQAATALADFLTEEDVSPEEEFVFQPMALDLGSGNEDIGTERAGYNISFTPQREFYDVGNDPIHLFNALEKLGSLKVDANLDHLPDDLDESDWESSYVKWDLELETDANEDVVKSVFGFVEDVSDIAISLMQCVSETPGLTEEIPNTESGLITVDVVRKKATARPTAPAAARETKATLRVDLERVDRLINSVGELIINQSVIAQRISDAGLGKPDEIQVDLEDFKHLAREIQEGVMAIRAQPVKPLFQRMARIVREVTSSSGKKVLLKTRGEGTEVDKTLVEKLSDPLTHMIRNAIDHGIEDVEVRISAGKSVEGNVELSAEHRSGNVLIEIRDDGAGLNREKIKKIAIGKGIIPPEAELSISEIDQLLFAPGFSTAEEVTNLSGRGVGMDVVKTAITSLGGKIGISSSPGEGSTFSITLPLTLAVMDGMVVEVGEQTMVVPISSIHETIKPLKENIFKIGVDSLALKVRGEYVPIVDLSEALGQGISQKEVHSKVLLLVSTEKIKQCAFAVDGISDQRQVVIKSLQGDYGDFVGVSAATILGDGKIALIVDPDGITNSLSSSFAVMKSEPLNMAKEDAHV